MMNSTQNEKTKVTIQFMRPNMPEDKTALQKLNNTIMHCLVAEASGNEMWWVTDPVDFWMPQQDLKQIQQHHILIGHLWHDESANNQETTKMRVAICSLGMDE